MPSLLLTELLINLGHRLELLVGGARDLPARHQAMRSAFDWSYALLDGPDDAVSQSVGVSGKFRRRGRPDLAAVSAS
jgi:predicted ATPase